MAELTGHKTGVQTTQKLVRRPGTAPGRSGRRWFYGPARIFSDLPPREKKLRDVESHHDEEAYETSAVAQPSRGW